MSVFKRGNTWWFEFVFNGARIRESARTSSKTIAKQAEMQRRRELEIGVNRISQPKRMPLFKVAAERLLADKRARRARNTAELYRFALKPVIEEFGGRLVSDITPEDIAAYQSKRLREGKAPRTVNLEVGALRVTLKAYRLWGSIADGVEMLRERKDVGRALSREDEQKLTVRDPAKPFTRTLPSLYYHARLGVACGGNSRASSARPESWMARWGD